jgi:hypothetical protein
MGKIMILLSLNIRGVGGLLKMASMRRLLSKTSPDILFLQETLVSEEKARLFVNSLRPDWMVCAINALGKSSGILVAWDPKVFILTPFLSCGRYIIDRSLCIRPQKDQLFKCIWPVQ